MKLIANYIKNLYAYSRGQFIMNLLFILIDGVTSSIGLVLLVPLLSLTGITGQAASSISFVDDGLALLNTVD
ncbi:MAG: hypothetical protein Q8917_18215, partial [Bacillota bacterium]|nr:hypothetical protein [Bacillota bacterium]